jgi:hypothetical protein
MRFAGYYLPVVLSLVKTGGEAGYYSSEDFFGTAGRLPNERRRQKLHIIKS